jgi:hypothetical protein
VAGESVNFYQYRFRIIARGRIKIKAGSADDYALQHIENKIYIKKNKKMTFLLIKAKPTE